MVIYFLFCYYSFNIIGHTGNYRNHPTGSELVIMHPVAITQRGRPKSMYALKSRVMSENNDQREEKLHTLYKGRWW